MASANFLPSCVIERSRSTLRDLTKVETARPTTSLWGDFWQGTAAERHRRQQGLRRAPPEFDAASVLQHRTRSRWRSSIPTIRRKLAGTASAAAKLTKRDGDQVMRWGIVMPSSYDYFGWILEALTMSNGGRWFNDAYGGEVYYNAPSTLAPSPSGATS